jgi:hypothetical protein
MLTSVHPCAQGTGCPYDLSCAGIVGGQPAGCKLICEANIGFTREMELALVNMSNSSTSWLRISGCFNRYNLAQQVSRHQKAARCSCSRHRCDSWLQGTY